MDSEGCSGREKRRAKSGAGDRKEKDEDRKRTTNRKNELSIMGKRSDFDGGEEIKRSGETNDEQRGVMEKEARDSTEKGMTAPR